MFRIAAVRLMAQISMSLLFAFCFTGCGGKEKENVPAAALLPPRQTVQPVSGSPGTGSVSAPASARSTHHRGAEYRRELRQQQSSAPDTGK